MRPYVTLHVINSDTEVVVFVDKIEAIEQRKPVYSWEPDGSFVYISGHVLIVSETKDEIMEAIR